MHGKILDILPVITYCYGLKCVVHKNTGRTSETFVRSYQDRIDVKIDVHGEVSIRCSGKAIYGRFRHQGDIRWRVEVDDIEGGGLS